MKIKEIKRKENAYRIYEITFTPNWLEKLFGIKEKTKEYADSGQIYTFGGGRVYVDKSGNRLSNGSRISEAIDRFRRSW